MERKSTHVPFAAPSSPQESRVARFAREIGWTVGPRNLLFEGESDVQLLELASRTYAQKTGIHLLGNDLKVISAGYGEEGGVGAVERKFMTIHELMKIDGELPRKERIRILPFFDDDEAGRGTFKSITQGRHPFRCYVDVFMLKRRYPEVRPGSPEYLSGLKECNKPWENIDCEIEDLLGRSFLDAFSEEQTNSLRCSPTIIGDGHHYEWDKQVKGRLASYAKLHAILDDMQGLVKFLRYVRWMFDLPNGHAGSDPS